MKSSHWVRVPFGRTHESSDDSSVLPDGRRTSCEDFRFALPAGTQYVAVTGYPPYPFVYTLVVSLPP